MDRMASASLKGLLLVAMPNLLDPNFFQTVTCIGEHNDQGAMGIVINRPHDFLTAKEIFTELKLECTQKAAQLQVHVGGPVHINEIFILHGPPLRWQGSFAISGTLALSNSMDLLKAIGQDRGPQSFIISLGCAGWGPGQLEAEIRQNAWLTAPMAEEILFETAVADRWEATLNRLGIDPTALSTSVGHA